MSHTPRTRWAGIKRPYTNADVARLRGTVKIEHTLARLGAERLWQLLQTEGHIHALGALTGNQAMQQVRAGLQAIYCSGWQVAADANDAGAMYPDQSLYPAPSVPMVVRRINNTLQRADQIEHAEGKADRHWFAPIVADAEAGFGGPLNACELMKAPVDGRLERGFQGLDVGDPVRVRLSQTDVERGFIDFARACRSHTGASSGTEGPKVQVLVPSVVPSV